VILAVTMEEAQQAQQKLQEAFAKADGEGIYWCLFEVYWVFNAPAVWIYWLVISYGKLLFYFKNQHNMTCLIAFFRGAEATPFQTIAKGRLLMHGKGMLLFMSLLIWFVLLFCQPHRFLL
jgi:hypothetical protein